MSRSPGHRLRPSAERSDSGLRPVRHRQSLANFSPFTLYGPGNKATIGSVGNGGSIDLEGASKPKVNGDVTNDKSGALSTSGNGGPAETRLRSTARSAIARAGRSCS